MTNDTPGSREMEEVLARIATRLLAGAAALEDVELPPHQRRFVDSSHETAREFLRAHVHEAAARESEEP